MVTFTGYCCRFTASDSLVAYVYSECVLMMVLHIFGYDIYIQSVSRCHISA